MTDAKRFFVFVMGSTASGKSDWALDLAEKFNGVILNCDSVQTYQKIEIGAAKPSQTDRSRVEHYLIDYVAPPHEITAGRYLRDYEECLKSIPVNRPVFLVGGTGFYFQAIEKGMYPVVPVSAEIKRQVEEQLSTPAGAQKMWQELQDQDPQYAAKINSADFYRLGRAIELIRMEGRSVTAIQNEFASGQKTFSEPLLKIAPFWEKEELNSRIFQRTQSMLTKGLVAEVESLLDEGLESWSPLSSVGYREVVAGLKKDSISEAELLEEITISTRQLAKKQRTWFKRDSEINWIPGGPTSVQVQDLVEKFLNS